MSAQEFFDVRSRGRVIPPEARQQMRDNRKARRRSAEALPAATAGAAPAGQSPQQAVIKLATWGKTVRAAQHSVAYITRTRPGDDPALALTATDHLGNPVLADHLSAAVDGWNLKANADNLSKAARDAEPAARAGMSEQDRYKARQSGHMILSMPPRCNASQEQVHQAAGEALREIFGPSGVEYLYVVHTDHSARPHAHVVFKATNIDGIQIRVQPDDLRVMREIFAAKATEAGIPLVATAREDRPELAPGIAAGEIPARTAKSYYDIKAEHSLKDIHWLSKRAPHFYDRHGAAYQQRLAGLTEPPANDPLQSAHDLALATVMSEPAPVAPVAAPAEAQAAQDKIDPLHPLVLLDALSGQSAVFSRTAIEREIAKHTRDPEKAAAALKAVLLTSDLVQLTPNPEADKQPPAKFALRATIELENHMLDVAEGLHERKAHDVAGSTFRGALARFEREAGYSLSDEQRQAVGHLVEAGDLRSVVGLPGTGKSTMLTAARMAWEEAGYEVKGAALAGIAADNLAQSGIKSSTLAALLLRIDEQSDLRPFASTGQLTEAAADRLDRHLAREIDKTTDQDTKQVLADWRSELAAGTMSAAARDYGQACARDVLRFPALTDRTVLVIDEAGMIGSAQMARILGAVEVAGAKLALIGDPEQIQPIEIGGAFRAIFQVTEGVTLEDVRRQREEWMRQATVDISQGRADAAIAAYDHAGAIHAGISADRAATLAQLEAQVEVSPDDRRRVNTIIDYIEARRSAGAAFYLQADHPNDAAVVRFAAIKKARDAAALAIAADIKAYRPWLARFTINGEHLAADLLVADGKTRERAIEDATRHAESLGIYEVEKSLPLEERLKLDLRSGARSELAAAWLIAYQQKPDAARIVLSHTNEDAHDLNTRIRQGLKHLGFLTGEAVTTMTEDGEREFMAGDRLLFRRSHVFASETEKVNVRNGTLGSVTGISRNAEGDVMLSVKLDSGASVSFSPDTFDGFAQGYAVTTHKAQGVTVDQSFVLASVGMNKHLLGVAMSRHREDTHVFAATVDAASAGQVAKIAGKAERSETTLDYIREPVQRFAAAHGIDPGVTEKAAVQRAIGVDRRSWIIRQTDRLAETWGAFRAHIQTRSAEQAPQDPHAPSRVELPALHAKAQLELQKTFRGYVDAAEARQKFLELYAEKAGLAVWTINNRPEVFGTVRPEAIAPKFNPRDAQISKEWWGEAAKRISSAAPPIPIVAKAILQAERSARKIASDRQGARRSAFSQRVARRAADRFGVLPGMQPTMPREPEQTTPQEPTPGLMRRIFRRGTPVTPTASMPAASTPTPIEPHWSERFAVTPKQPDSGQSRSAQRQATKRRKDRDHDKNR
jgi:ATP-dependent exoDNAse (exonuclease V) alpha subunit